VARLQPLRPGPLTGGQVGSSRQTKKKGQPLGPFRRGWGFISLGQAPSTGTRFRPAGAIVGSRRRGSSRMRTAVSVPTMLRSVEARAVGRAESGGTFSPTHR